MSAHEAPEPASSPPTGFKPHQVAIWLGIGTAVFIVISGALPLITVEAEEPDSHLRLIEEHGEEVLNRAWENAAPLHVFSMDRGWLLDLLEDSDFLCVMVDGRLKLRQDLIEELSTDA